MLEATGSAGVARAVTLHEAGYQVAVVNPAQLHSYAQSLPRRGTTDALDAQVCVRFAAERKPTPWAPPGVPTALIRRYFSVKTWADGQGGSPGLSAYLRQAPASSPL